MPVDNPTHQRLEQAVRRAVRDLKQFTGFDGFVLDMPAGRDRPPHLIVVGTAAEIGWLLDQREARRRDAETAAAGADTHPHRDRH
jgi:hypothetical protein